MLDLHRPTNFCCCLWTILCFSTVITLSSFGFLFFFFITDLFVKFLFFFFFPFFTFPFIFFLFSLILFFFYLLFDYIFYISVKPSPLLRRILRRTLFVHILFLRFTCSLSFLVLIFVKYSVLSFNFCFVNYIFSFLICDFIRWTD